MFTEIFDQKMGMISIFTSSRLNSRKKSRNYNYKEVFATQDITTSEQLKSFKNRQQQHIYNEESSDVNINESVQGGQFSMLSKKN